MWVCFELDIEPDNFWQTEVSSIAVNLSTMGGGKKRKNAIVSMEEMASNKPQAQEKPSKRSKKITQLVK